MISIHNRDAKSWIIEPLLSENRGESIDTSIMVTSESIEHVVWGAPIPSFARAITCSGLGRVKTKFKF
jgi:hypothetical protein